MPLIPTCVGFSQGDALVPTSAAFVARAIFALSALGFLEADITLRAALSGDASACETLTAFLDVQPTLDGTLKRLRAILAGEADFR